MDNLKKLEGNTIQSIKENTDGKNSYFIIEFNNNTKLTIISYPHGDKGVANLDINLNKMKPEELIGKQVMEFKEEFDGVNEHLTIKFKDNTNIKLSPFSSIDDQTAGLDYTIYLGNKIVAESLEELYKNKIKI